MDIALGRVIMVHLNAPPNIKKEWWITFCSNSQHHVKVAIRPTIFGWQGHKISIGYLTLRIALPYRRASS
jgi:hypothetical protein